MPHEYAYKITKTPVDEVVLNPNNPRTISDDKFSKLVKSIKDAPWMLKLRPIVVNSDGVILGGNQRFKACVQAGMDHVWVIWADDIDSEQARRFILRDNVDFGKWDLEILKRQYSSGELLDYGGDIQLLEMSAGVSTGVSQGDVDYPPLISEDDDCEPYIPQEELDESSKNFNDKTIKQIVFQLPSDIYEDSIKSLDHISKELDLDDNSEVLMHLMRFYEISNVLENADNDSF